MRDSFHYDDQLFRFGGEEFIAVLQPTSQANAERAFERSPAVERHGFAEAGRVTVSIGICHLQPQDSRPPSSTAPMPRSTGPAERTQPCRRLRHAGRRGTTCGEACQIRLRTLKAPQVHAAHKLLQSVT
jgi:hypothetical protein